MIFLQFLGLAVGIFALVKITGRLMILIKVIGHRLGWPVFIVSSIFLATATSFPEIFIGVTSSFRELGALSLGNILGANLINITFVLGIATIISNGVTTREKTLVSNMREVAVISITPYLLLFDKELSRIDGIIMVLIYIVYLVFLVEKEKTIYRLPDSIPHNHSHTIASLVVKFILWLITLSVAAYLVVVTAEGMANFYQISDYLVGLLLLSLGTTLPEMVVGIKSAGDREAGIFFGNILGSLAVNSSLALGLVAIINPIHLEAGNGYLFPGILSLTVFLLLPCFIKTKLKLERREGLVLLAIYLVFLIFETLVV